MLYLNYEESLILTDAGDPLVHIVGGCLNGFMISEKYRSRDLRPGWPFDMRYLYTSVSEVMAAQIGHTFRISLPTPPHITISNIPDLKSYPWRDYDFIKLGLGLEYIEQVRSDAVPNGKPFDIEFALHVICGAMVREVIEAIPSEIEYINEHPDPYDFDEWLKGFTTQPE